MAGLFTQAQWERQIGARKVAELCSADPDDAQLDVATVTADPDVVADLIESASDTVQEAARSAGTTLTLATITAANRERAIWIASHRAASRGQRNRDKDGRAPYFQEYVRATRELGEWAARVRPQSVDTPYEVPLVVSDDPRGW